MATSVRQLSRDYSDGKLSGADYRHERARLLKGIVRGDIPLVPFQVPAPPAVRPKAAGAPEPGEGTAQIKKRSGSIWWVAAAVGAIAAGGGLYLTFSGKPAEPVATQATAPAADAARTLAQEFVDRKNWRPEAIEEFQRQWAALEAAQRQGVIDSPLFGRLAAATYGQLMEEQALADLGDVAESLAQQHLLLRFAETMGFTDPRFKDAADALARREATEAQAVAVAPATPSPAPKPAPPAEPVAAPAVAEAPAAVAAPAAAEEAKPEPAVEPPSPPATEMPAVEAAPPAPEQIAQAPAEAVAPATEPAPAAATPEAMPSPVPEPTPAPPPGTPAAEKKETGEAAPASADTEAPAGEKSEVAAPAAKTRKSLACRAELAKQRKNLCRDALTGGGTGPIMVVLPAGEFSMGGDAPHAQPAHRVNIGQPFAMAIHEVSQVEFESFCKATGRNCPSQPWSGADYPVVNVSWSDAAAYAEWLANATAKRYRLPTEAEWEYGARAGAATRFPFGDELLPTHARFSYQAPVDSPLPRTDKTINRNGFKLYHMVGNVREWVQDAWHDSFEGAPGDGSAWASGGSDRVVRGGAYKDRAEALQSAARERMGAGSADPQTGFRVVQEVPASAASGDNTGVSGPAWVASQGRNQYTLQLFAVRNLDKVESLIDAHPELEIMILPTPDTKTPYRVYYGIFDSAEAAKAAFRDLPADVIAQVEKPIAKSFAELQRLLAQR